MKKIIVVGGGTAGWLTALYIKKVYPDFKLTVVESKEIGILGAGEGSTPQMIGMLDFLEIQVSDIISNCEATIKNGIKFTNWNNDNKYYYHPFKIADYLSLGNMNLDEKALCTNSLALTSLYINKSLNSFDFIEQISEENRVPFILNGQRKQNPIFDFDLTAYFSIHFNASKIAVRLKEIGIKRGIDVVDGVVSDIILDKNKYIEKIIIDDKNSIDCDFVFDCTGFHRLIIGKLYNSEWHSYSKYLPVDSALPFFIEMDKEIPPYTEAIAMKYGWMWKIPLQSRYGCGYVFDSSLISEKEVIKEIEEHLGFEPHYPRKNKGSFKFNAGYYKEPWINNCIAVGLSGGFIEPLEATSIWSSIVFLSKVLSGIEWVYNNNQTIRDDFNETFIYMNEKIVDFIYFHYMTKRKDTDFWKKFTYENAPESLKKKLNLWKYRMPNNYDSDSVWGFMSWMQVGAGTQILNQDVVDLYNKKSSAQIYGFEKYEESNFIDNINLTLTNCMKHSELLKYLKDNNEF